MNTIIRGISVTADSGITLDETSKLVSELVQYWSLEEKRLGKIELIREGQWAHVCSYE